MTPPKLPLYGYYGKPGCLTLTLRGEYLGTTRSEAMARRIVKLLNAAEGLTAEQIDTIIPAIRRDIGPT